MMKAGLLAACFGAALLAFSSFRGMVTGFVGTTVWPHPGSRLANLAGWLLMIGGFLLQYLHVRHTPPSTQPTRTVEALLNVLDRKGVITTAEVPEESARLGEKSVTDHYTDRERRGGPRRLWDSA